MENEKIAADATSIGDEKPVLVQIGTSVVNEQKSPEQRIADALERIASALESTATTAHYARYDGMYKDM